MNKSCCINFCDTSGDRTDSNRLYTFPDNPNLQNVWCDAVLKYTGQKVDTKIAKICSKHFSDFCFENRTRKRILKRTAIPFEGISSIDLQVHRIKLEDEDTTECAVLNCGNVRSETKYCKPHIIYYIFPNTAELAEKWKAFCKKSDLDIENSYICSEHFLESDFVEIISQKPSEEDEFFRALILDAVPTIYYENNASLEVIPNKKKRCNKSLTATIDLDSIRSSSPLSSDIHVPGPSRNQISEDNEVHIIDDDSSISQFAESIECEPVLEDEIFCCIRDCNSNTSNEKVHYFGFPNNPSLRKMWVDQVTAYFSANDREVENGYICSLHFESKFIKLDLDNQTIFLDSKAYPTIFPASEDEIFTLGDDNPNLSDEDFHNVDKVKEYYQWSIRNHKKLIEYIQFLKNQQVKQSKQIANIARSIDDFKSKQLLSDAANESLQKLFNRVIDAQYDFI